MKETLISVIVPVRNGEAFLRTTLESVLAQTYRPFEIVVVDGCSSDGTAAIAQSFPEVVYVREEGEPNIARGRNLGVSTARGELIAMVSSDDLWDPRKLTLQARALVDEGARYSVCRLRHFLDREGEPPKGFRPELLQEDVVGYMPETLLAEAGLFEEFGGFDESLGIAEDLDWFQRLRDASVPVAVVDETLLFKRVHADSLSYSSPSYHSDILGLLRRRARERRASSNG